MLSKIYLEITNVCNLDCSFCHGTKREPRFMSISEFEHILDKISGCAEYLYFHLMGEPLLHPDIEKMAQLAKRAGFSVMLTTNGTLLREKGYFIPFSGNIKKISVSLHSLDMTARNGDYSLDDDQKKYLYDCCSFAKSCAKSGVICVLRLWNIQKNGEDINRGILDILHSEFGDTWIKNRSGYKLFDSPVGQNEVYLEYGEKFDWPDEHGEKRNTVFCHGLKSQIGILCDGTVVPCCLDAEGAVCLGNIFDSELSDILGSPRAKRLLSSFEERSPCEKLCQSCGFAERFR